MTDELPECDYCKAKMKARSNKRFCSDRCRSDYHAELAKRALTGPKVDSGVMIDIDTGEWLAFIYVNGKREIIDSFKTMKEAKDAVRRCGQVHSL